MSRDFSLFYEEFSFFFYFVLLEIALFQLINKPYALGKITGKVGNQRTNQYSPNYGIIKISLNAEKSPRDLRKLVVSQTPVNCPQLTPVSKNSRRGK